MKLTVTASDPNETIKLKTLGFMGIMVQGAHHQPHHLMIAKGELPTHSRPGDAMAERIRRLWREERTN